MQNFIYLALGLIQFSIAIVGLRNIRLHFTWYAGLVLIVVFGLAYDNLVLAAGGFIEEGSLLKALNWPRYAVHGLFTPAMIIAAFGTLRMAGIKFAQSRGWHTAICTVATVLIALGVYIDIIKLDLVPAVEDGLVRYVNDFVLIPGPPIPAVLTIVFVLGFGIPLWSRANWPWLFAGALLMFVTAPLVDFGLVQNTGEIAFAGGLVATVIHTHRKPAAERG